MEMPQINWPEGEITKAPSNKEFFAVKKDLLEDMMKRMKPYLQAVYQIPGIQERKDIREAIYYILREFIVYFWDVPASEKYHHAQKWGLLSHSAEVALLRAKDASQYIAVDNEGNPSAEARHKTRGEQVFIAWMSGLLHDSGKIFDMDLYSPNSRAVYHPFRGNVLGFKLKAAGNVALNWQPNRGMRHARRNLAMLMALVPMSFLKQMSQEQLLNLFEGLIEDGDSADQESVAEARAEEDREYVQEAIKLFARDKFVAKDRKGRLQKRVFKLDDDNFLLVNPLVYEALAKYIKDDLGVEYYGPDQVVNYLVNNDLVCKSSRDDGGGHYFIKLNANLNEHKLFLHVSFARGSMFSGVDTSDVYMIKLHYDSDTNEKIKEIIGYDPPEEWFLDHPGKEKKSYTDNKDTENENEDADDPFSDMENNVAEKGSFVEGEEGNENPEMEEDNPDLQACIKAMQNMAKFMDTGDIFVNSVDKEEKNVGFMSANDGLFWADPANLIRRPIYQRTGYKNKDQAIEGLERVGWLVKDGEKKVLEATSTRFYGEGGELLSAPESDYIRLDVNKIKSLVPELEGKI